MKRLIIFMLAACVLVACAPTVRYSFSEIEKYPPQIQELIKKGEVALGMTEQQVRYAWGAPNKVIVKGADDQGRFIEEWIYAPARVFGKKVVFADGKLIKAYTRVTRSDVRDEREKEPASRNVATPEKSGGGQSPESGEIQK
jgi:hypothetical protein